MNNLNQRILEYFAKNKDTAPHPVGFLAECLQAKADEVQAALDHMESLDIVKSEFAFGRIRWDSVGKADFVTPAPVVEPIPVAEPVPVIETVIQEPEPAEELKDEIEAPPSFFKPVPMSVKQERINLIKGFLKDKPKTTWTLHKDTNLGETTVSKIVNSVADFSLIPNSKPRLYTLSEKLQHFLDNPKLVPNKSNACGLSHEETERRFNRIKERLSDGVELTASTLSTMERIAHSYVVKMLEGNPIFAKVPNSRPVLWTLAASLPLPKPDETEPQFPIRPVRIEENTLMNIENEEPKHQPEKATPEKSYRFGMFDDGIVEIHSGDQVIELTPDAVRRLVKFVKNGYYFGSRGI